MDSRSQNQNGSSSVASSVKRSIDELDDLPTSKSRSKKQRVYDQRHFSNLPEEVKGLIFENLGFNDLMTSSLVCKEWNGIINDNCKLTDKIRFRLPAELITRPFADPFERKYRHIGFDKLPTRTFIRKFENVRQCVASIELKFANVRSFESVCELLEYFPNLSALKLIQTRGDNLFSTRMARNFFHEPVNFRSTNLTSLKSLDIKAKAPGFVRVFLNAIKNSQLQSFKLCAEYMNFRSNAAQHKLLSDELVGFLNSQSNLRELHLIAYDKVFVASSFQDHRLIPMKLETLKLDMEAVLLRIDVDNASSCFDVMQILLNSCRDTCKTLKILSMCEHCHKALADSLSGFTKLENLILEYISCYWTNLGDAEPPKISPLLPWKTMRCNLKNVIIYGEGNDFKFDSDHYEFMSSMLMKQQNSLQKLMIEPFVPSSHSLWNVIGSLPNLELVCAQLSKATLMKMSGSMKYLVNCSGKPLTRTDEAFWRRFRKRNPNFDSIRSNSFLDEMHSLKL